MLVCVVYGTYFLSTCSVHVVIFQSFEVICYPMQMNILPCQRLGEEIENDILSSIVVMSC